MIIPPPNPTVTVINFTTKIIIGSPTISPITGHVFSNFNPIGTSTPSPMQFIVTPTVPPNSMSPTN